MKLLVLLLTMVFAVSAFAAEDDDIAACLRAWGKHPFAKTRPEFRAIEAKVRVMGIGGNVEDTRPTEKPELVLIKPAVSVMSKTVMELKNPNGWYCLRGKVDVLGKTIINLACNAHLATSKGNVAVLGSNQEEKGVTVLGKSVINREACVAKGEKHSEKTKESKEEAKDEAKDKAESKPESKTE